MRVYIYIYIYTSVRPVAASDRVARVVRRRVDTESCSRQCSMFATPNHPNHPNPNHLTHPRKAGTALLPCRFRRRCADVAYMCETDRQIRQMFGLICMSA